MTALVEVVRSGYVEGTHHGAVIALRPDGSVALALGQLDRPYFPRSANKPLQAAALLDAGWEPDCAEQVALAAASHSGEPGHVAEVRTMLGTLGPTALQCPEELPYGEAAAHDVLRAGGGPTRLSMNCSGKHAAMLSTCVANGWPLETYRDPTHPVQQACLDRLEDWAGERVRHVAVDGCGAAQHALTLPGLARAFSRLVIDGASHGATVVDAMRTHPWHVGGTGRDVTALMQAVPGLIAKDGAEGVYAAALPDGSAVAVKIYDGSARARVPVLVAALRALGCDAPALEAWATSPVLGGGAPVGEVRVSAELARLT